TGYSYVENAPERSIDYINPSEAFAEALTAHRWHTATEGQRIVADFLARRAKAERARRQDAEDVGVPPRAKPPAMPGEPRTSPPFARTGGQGRPDPQPRSLWLFSGDDVFATIRSA